MLYVWEKLKFYNLLSPARGQRGGNHLRRANEKAINTIKPFVRRQNVIAKQRGINSANLLNIQTSILNINYNSGIVEAGQNNNVFHNGYNKLLPRFCLMNDVRSLLPKIDELCAFVSSTPIDIIAITESWLNEDIDNNILSINGFNIHRNDRSILVVAVVFVHTYLRVSPRKEGRILRILLMNVCGFGFVLIASHVRCPE